MENQEIRALEPAAAWNHFADLNAVPRASKNEEQVIAFIKEFGKRLNLETIEDHAGNVIIRKPATQGMENRKTVVMQSHLDMVHQKNKETDFDFSKEGIRMKVAGDWVKAEGTTLGADNGLGVASIMAVLSSDTIVHPAIEALFTIDEETGMTGAKGLQENLLKGTILLNLDTEEDDEISIGCAGGVDITARKSYVEEDLTEDYSTFLIKINGLTGGHSGMEIHKGLGNANKIMNRLLLDAAQQFEFRISRIEGGGLRNAIPRESEAEVSLNPSRSKAFKNHLTQYFKLIKKEFAKLDASLNLTISETKQALKLMPQQQQQALLHAIQCTWNGVYRMSPDMEDLVETSNNLARVSVKNGSIEVLCLTRSSVESSRDDLAHTVKAAYELIGATVLFSDEYPGWQPNLESPILKLLVAKYERMNNTAPRVAAGHAGLECGIIGEHYPQLDMISFGPTIRGAHSPDERASISSFQKFWNFLIEVLKDTPKE